MEARELSAPRKVCTMLRQIEMSPDEAREVVERLKKCSLVSRKEREILCRDLSAMLKCYGGRPSFRMAFSDYSALGEEEMVKCARLEKILLKVRRRRRHPTSRFQFA